MSLTEVPRKWAAHLRKQLRRAASVPQLLASTDETVPKSDSQNDLENSSNSAANSELLGSREKGRRDKKDDGESESAANAQRSDSVVKCDAVARGVNIESVKRRLCAREGALELLGFVAWLLFITAHVAQIWALWLFFWRCVVGDPGQSRPRRGGGSVSLAVEAAEAAVKGSSALASSLAATTTVSSAHHRLKRCLAFAVWCGWVFGLLGVERPLLKRRIMPPTVFTMCVHAEFFALSGLAMTLCTNFASYLHEPGKRLFDVGFFLVPELGKRSHLEPVSDALTGLLPVAAFVYFAIFLDRRRRCRAVTDWFRMMTIVYCFRCITSTMTSLPGPAPHCAPRAYHTGLYLPPQTWWEIATSLTAAASGGTCGDLLFSGHAAMTTITTLLLVRQQRRHGRRVESVAKACGCGYIFLVCIFALASRKHYTVDLALGTLIGSLTYFRFRDSWSRDPVLLDRLDAVSRYRDMQQDEHEADEADEAFDNAFDSPSGGDEEQRDPED